jgi:hypothetical protein
VPDFSPVITLAYMRILGRRPDPGGLASWNRSMNDGLSEAGMREGLLRSAEYAQAHPDLAARARRVVNDRTARAVSKAKRSQRTVKPRAGLRGRSVARRARV